MGQRKAIAVSVEAECRHLGGRRQIGLTQPRPEDHAQPDLQRPQPPEEANREWGEETYRDDDHEARRR
jgi:hypothetical protein